MFSRVGRGDYHFCKSRMVEQELAYDVIIG